MIRRYAFSLLAAIALTLGTLTALAPPAESEGTYVILSEDFDDGWDVEWNATDHNTDSGLDYWGISSYRKLTGGASAWCARVGTNSVNSYPNIDNRYYDQDMQAVLQTPLQDLSGFDSASLRFYYWAETGSLSLDDFLEVRVWNGWYWDRIWKQPDVDTGGAWDLVIFDIPLNTIWISFSFISNDIVGDGPYEGVYIDAIRVYGYDATPPVSSMTSLDEYSSSETIYITYTAVDRGGSGVSHVELYYRAQGSAEEYEMYTTPDTIDGKWTEGIIPFNCSSVGGVGGYDFYTLAEDMMGNREMPVNIPQTSTVIDVQAPTTVAETGGGSLPDGWINSSTAIELNASDDISGIAAIRYRVDSGSWEDYEDAIEVSEEGSHSISYYSEDNAGNMEGVKTIEFATDTTVPIATVSTEESTAVFTVSDVSFIWGSEDELSGIDYCLFKVDDRAFEFLGEPDGVVEAVHLDSGNHTATLRAVDNAGNTYETTCAFEVDLGDAVVETEQQSNLFNWAAALVVLAAAIAAALMLMRQYQKEKQ